MIRIARNAFALPLLLIGIALASSASRAQDVPNAPPVPADARWVDVLVVDAENGKPVPGVEVQWTDDRVLQWPLPSIEAPLLQPPPKQFEPFRRRGTSDERGRVRHTRTDRDPTFHQHQSLRQQRRASLREGLGNRPPLDRLHTSAVGHELVREQLLQAIHQLVGPMTFSLNHEFGAAHRPQLDHVHD